MKVRGLLTAVAAGAAIGMALLGGAPSAAAGAPVLGAHTVPATTLFGGFGIGQTADEALDKAVADAQAQASAAGFTDCAVAGDPIIQGLVRPGFPVTYLAQVALGCTG